MSKAFKMNNLGILLAILFVASAQTESNPTIVNGIIEEEVQQQISSELRHGRQFRGGGSSASHQSPQELVSDIHCMKTATKETFTAFLRLPTNFVSAPVLDSVAGNSLDPTECLITRTNVDGIFAIDLSSMSACGVTHCQNDQELWMCVTIRFPMLPGLKLPEDEVIDIKCKPQDPAISGSNVINFQENVVEQRSPTIYIGGGQEFLSEIGLFRKLAGTELFASRVKSGSTIELGENVQLRSIVRSGDGWNYAKITDVMVHRVHDGQALHDTKNTAELVGSNGCRNGAYAPLAPFNPWRDANNGLINNFDFRVFMFQEMLSGDSIMITAKVVACVEQIDCAPVNCGQNEDPGYGKRRKRRSLKAANNQTKEENEASNLNEHIYVGKTKNWEENLELKIRLPPDLLVNPLTSLTSHSASNGYEGRRPLHESECKLYLIITLSVALTFCVLSATIVSVACFKKYQETKAMTLAQTNEEEREQMARREVKSVPPLLHSIPLVSPPTSASTASRPVTVRSVKRRDKAKVEERRLSQGKVTRSPEDNRTPAVMV